MTGTPEDGDQYDALSGFARRLMAEVERDLGTKLDWIAVDHHNAGHPHSHVVIRGRDDAGTDLIIARDYLTRGMRERAQAVVTLELGPRTDHEIEHKLRQEVEQKRLTGLDRSLIREAGETGLVDARASGCGEHSRFRQALKLGRLHYADLGAPAGDLAREGELVSIDAGTRGPIVTRLAAQPLEQLANADGAPPGSIANSRRRRRRRSAMQASAARCVPPSRGASAG